MTVDKQGILEDCWTLPMQIHMHEAQWGLTLNLRNTLYVAVLFPLSFNFMSMNFKKCYRCRRCKENVKPQVG